MKKRKPIFIEFSIISLAIITTIILTYTIAQIFTISLITKDYNEDHIKNSYESLTYLVSKLTIDESNIDSIVNDDENIRIYKEGSDKYLCNDESIWSNVELRYDSKVKVTDQYIDGEEYVLLTGPAYINDERYMIQILHEKDIDEDLIEGYYPIFFTVFIFGIILSILGSLRLSRKFVNKIDKLSNEIEEAKVIGLKHRIDVSDFNDEFDRIAILFNSMMDTLEDTFEEQQAFISNASHELRTPLTALKGHLSMIRRWGKNDKERMEKSLDICINETDRLIRIVNELLSLMRAEREYVDLNNVREIKVLPVIKECINHYNILHENIEFNVQVDENADLKILEDHLKQLLIIFIDNSIKYNNKDICKIDIKLNKDNGKTKLEVIDNGIGIPKEDIPYVLNKFYKVDKSRVNNNSYGIGLSIANKIIKNYNGKIYISSEENIYTKVEIEI